jgi:hypothetical protein
MVINVHQGGVEESEGHNREGLTLERSTYHQQGSYTHHRPDINRRAKWRCEVMLIQKGNKLPATCVGKAWSDRCR